MKTKFFVFALLITTGLFAQKPKISSAVIGYNGQDFAKAKQYIDEAEEIYIQNGYQTSDIKTLGKFYYYKGQIYLAIQFSNDSLVKGLDADALEKSTDGFLKLLDLESNQSKKRYTQQSIDRIPYLTNGYAIKGSELDQQKDYEGAKAAFLKAYEIKQLPVLGDAASTDTNFIFNAAIMAVKGKDYKEATTLFEKVLDMGYNGYSLVGVTADGQEIEIPSKLIPNKSAAEKMLQSGGLTEIKQVGGLRLDTYFSLISSYKNLEDEAGYHAALAKARAEYPSNVELLNLEIQSYLDKKQFDEALEMLDKAIEADPSNKLYYFVKGNLYQNEKKDVDKALIEYNKALEIDNEYSDVLYMSGLANVEKANKIADDLNALPLSAKSKYKELKDKQTGLFNKALTYFEKAYEVNPNDKDTVNALKEVYYKLGNSAKALEMNNLLKTM